MDGKEPVGEKLYKQLWELQDAFQDPSNQSEPNKFGETTFKIATVLTKLQQEQIGVASTTTAVPQGESFTTVQHVVARVQAKIKLLMHRFGRGWHGPAL